MIEFYSIGDAEITDQTKANIIQQIHTADDLEECLVDLDDRAMIFIGPPGLTTAIAVIPL